MKYTDMNELVDEQVDVLQKKSLSMPPLSRGRNLRYFLTAQADTSFQENFG